MLGHFELGEGWGGFEVFFVHVVFVGDPLLLGVDWKGFCRLVHGNVDGSGDAGVRVVGVGDYDVFVGGDLQG